MRYADGLLEKDGKSIYLREVEKDLRQIKGIGDKRIEEIMAVFEKHLGVWKKPLSGTFHSAAFYILTTPDKI